MTSTFANRKPVITADEPLCNHWVNKNLKKLYKQSPTRQLCLSLTSYSTAPDWMDSIHIIRIIHWYFPCTGPLSCMWDPDVVCVSVVRPIPPPPFIGAQIPRCQTALNIALLLCSTLCYLCVIITWNCLEKTMLHQQVTNQKNNLDRVSPFFSWKKIPNTLLQAATGKDLFVAYRDLLFASCVANQTVSKRSGL